MHPTQLIEVEFYGNIVCPDEKGTEMNRCSYFRSPRKSETLCAPMRRGLKSNILTSSISPPIGNIVCPDEKGTEILWNIEQECYES